MSDLSSRGVDAVLLGALAGVLFGALAVAVKYGLSRGVPLELGAVVSAGSAFALLAPVALGSGSFADHVDVRDVVVFAGIGACVPGLSQIAFVHAVHLAGAARTTILIGIAPLLSFALAAVFLGEGISAGLVAGAALIVAACASLSFERTRPADFRAIGAVLAVVCAGLFAVRDTLVRWGSEDATMDPLLRTVVSLGAAALVVAVWACLSLRGRPSTGRLLAIKLFLPAGACLAAAYLCLILALDRGHVTTVAPLNATQSLWVVVFAAIFLGKREAVGPRLVAAAVIVVAGGVLIGASR
jgi:drug/metabolite transporter (DMT)-like permease